jgi:hypothetical protein
MNLKDCFFGNVSASGDHVRCRKKAIEIYFFLDAASYVATRLTVLS